MSLFVGTLTLLGIAAPPIDLVWSSDRLAGSLSIFIANDPASDPRLTTAALAPLTDPVGFIAWALAGPDNLPNALVARGAALDAIYGTGALALGPTTLLRSATSYLGSTDVDFFDGPCNGAAASCVVVNNYRANVSVYQQTAVWTLSNQNPNPTVAPEPGTLSLLGAGLLVALVVLRRRASLVLGRGSLDV